MVAPAQYAITFLAIVILAVGGCQLPGTAPAPGVANKGSRQSALKPPMANAPPQMVVRGQNGFSLPSSPVPAPGTDRMTRGPLRGIPVQPQAPLGIQQVQNVLPPPVNQPPAGTYVPPATNAAPNYGPAPTYAPVPNTYVPPAMNTAPTYGPAPTYAPVPNAYGPAPTYGNAPAPPAGISAVPSIGSGVNYGAGQSFGPAQAYNGSTLYGPAVSSNIEPLSPIREVPVDVWLTEARTGRFMIGGAVNSDAGVTGQIVIDERNFDITRVPRSFSEVFSGRAFRGAGQSFRIEAVPGSRFQRYMVSFAEPYLFGYLPLSFSINGFLFDRRYQDYDETRVGGRTALGYRITPDLTLELGIRGENVEFKNPRIRGIPEVDRLVGNHDIFGASLRLTHDTRDIPFAPTEGHLLSLEYEQVFGSFDYPRFNGRFQNFTLLKQRPDSSGRHTLAFSYDLGISGSQTPIFENYFAGGYSTLRGFSFRGAGPEIATFQTGGRFRFLGSAEYQFPITADDMFKGVVFLDYGTVERDIQFKAENLRVAPGFGFRVAIPAMGPAPLAFDFGFPIASAPTDQRQLFSFFVGFNR